MKNDFEVRGPFFEKAAECVRIIRGLPEWFGIQSAIQGYAREIDRLPTFLAKSGKKVLGFLSLKQNTPYAAEIYVMGVRPEAQHHGLGRSLVERAETYARKLGIEYLQVKTLGPSNPDSGYAKTRAFYLAMGFRPLEEFKRIWNEQNPCLILVKQISCRPPGESKKKVR